jgi:hypothetical protein
MPSVRCLEQADRWTCPVFATYTHPLFARLSLYGRGMLRRLLRAISNIRPTPPLSITLPPARAKLPTSSAVIFGGTESALGSVTSSTSW